MTDNTAKNARKRGQRRNNIDIPRRFLDHLSPAVLEESYMDNDTSSHISAHESPDVFTLDKLFHRYYGARQAAGASERTLEDYVKHMRWFRSFMASEYGGLTTLYQIVA